MDGGAAGIPNFEYPSLGQEAIMEELEKKYPDFEKRTGWRLDSAYKEEMPEDLAQEVTWFLGHQYLGWFSIFLGRRVYRVRGSGSVKVSPRARSANSGTWHHPPC